MGTHAGELGEAAACAPAAASASHQVTGGVWSLQVGFIQGWFRKDTHRLLGSPNAPSEEELCWCLWHGASPVHRAGAAITAWHPCTLCPRSLADGPGAEGSDQPHVRGARAAQEEAVHFLQHLPPALQLCSKWYPREHPMVQEVLGALPAGIPILWAQALPSLPRWLFLLRVVSSPPALASVYALKLLYQPLQVISGPWELNASLGFPELCCGRWFGL